VELNGFGDFLPDFTNQLFSGTFSGSSWGVAPEVLDVKEL
jgi:hypothetical protein